MNSSSPVNDYHQSSGRKLLRKGEIRRAAVLACGVCTVAIGLLALVGWGCKIEVLRSVLPGLPPILHVSALCFVLLGSALVSVVLARTKAIATFLAITVLIASAKTLLHYLLPGHVPLVGEMPPNTAVCFVLTSVSILLFSLFKGKPFSVGVALSLTSLASIVAFGAALGIISGLTAAYGWGTFAPMALNSAAAFLLLCVGIITLHLPQQDVEHDLDFTRRVVPLYSTLGAFVILSFAMLSVMIPLFVTVEEREKESVLVEAKLVAAEVALGKSGLTEKREGVFYLFKKGGSVPDIEWKESLLRAASTGKGAHLLSDDHRSNDIIAVAPVANSEDFVVYIVERRSLLRWVNGHLLFSLLGAVIFTIAAISLLLRLLRPLTMAAFKAVEVLKENERELDRRVREATQELEHSLALNQRILEYSVDMICGFDDQGRFVQVSPACLDILGYSQAELMGRPYTDFVHPEDRALTEEEASRITAGRSTHDFRNRYVRKDGTIADMMWSACWSDRDQIMFCVARDITRMREVENQLKESVAFAHSVLASLTSTTAVLDQSGTIVAVNNEWRNFARDNGGSESCIGGIGMNYLESCGEAEGCVEASASYDGIKSVLLGESEQFDLIYPCDSPAEKRWFLLRAVPLPRGGAVVSHLDITQLKLSELSLQELNRELEVRTFMVESTNNELMRTKNFLRAMIDHLPVAVFAKEGGKEKFGQFKLWNRMSENLFGISSQKVLGKTDYDFFPKEEADLFQAKDEFAFEVGAPQRIEEEHISSLTLGKRTLHTVKVPIFDNEGRPDTLLGISLDITDRKRAEAEVVTKAYQLEKASRYKSLFLANMSHEIRTPLTSVIGYTESLLQDEVPHEEEKEALRTIQRNSRHLLGVINDILDFSKIEVGKLEFEMVDTQLFELIRDVENLIRLQAEEKGIAFDITLEYPMPTSIVTDPTRLKQILINLMGNAVKFTRVGGVAVEVSHKGDLLRVEVKDTGIGMNEEQRERLFKPFSQGDTSTTRQYGGTGLGLTISRELAKGLGGDISVESQAGVGSTFTLSILAERGTDSELINALPERAGCGGSVPVVERFFGKVLLAEDGEDNQRYVSLLLRRAGVDFVIVENGARAVERVGAEEFDLILMDMQMPILDGYSATRALRKRGCEVPIVALTANAMKSDVERTFEVGCSSFLGKPFTRASFFSALARYLPAREVSQVPCEVRQMVEEDRELKELVLSFLDRLPAQLAEIETGVELGDFGIVKATSHKLAGAASLYGIKEVGEAAAALETAAKGGHRGVIATHAKALKEGVEAVLACRGAIESL